MNTEVLRIDPKDIDFPRLKKAAIIIRKGGLVAFPTETVYGLGADALNPLACAKIFQAKNRPLDDPLIVHIGERAILSKLVLDTPDIALKLSDEFWPGPLTLVLKKSKLIPDIVTAGLDTVAIRMPNHKVALSLIKETDTPIAAPSANLFGTPSPVTCQHVLDDLDGKIDMVIDGGKVKIGVESTVLDLTQGTPCILRPGGISVERLKEVVKNLKFYKGRKTLSPGMYPRHYSPKAKLVLVEGNGKVQVERIKSLASEFKGQGYSIGIITKEEHKGQYVKFKVKSLGPGNDLTICATNLFSALRELDREGLNIIIAEGVKEEGLGLAIMDRLRKASWEIK